MMEIATREAVWKAAEELAQKKPASEVKVAEIRAIVGGGSYTTITKRLAEWRTEREKGEAFRSLAPDMPDEVRSLWERVWQLADAQHHEVREAWLQEKRKLSDDVVECSTEIARLENEIADLRENCDALTQEIKEARQAASSAEKERDLAVARAETTASQQEQMIEKLAARLQRHPFADENAPKGRLPNSDRDTA